VIAESPDDVTAAVLAEIARAPDPRFREVMAAAVRHLHAFAREVRLGEAEFQQACALVARLGQLTTSSHNEVVLAAGSLGLSALVCLVNNGDGGREPTTANLLGPFWREGAPPLRNGDSIVRSPTPGATVFVEATVRDRDGHPIAGADVDVWQASPEGWYENQDPAQADMNLRGRFVSDADGHVAFRTVKPAGYPIPVSGPVGALLRAQGRHNLRPAHIHFMIRAAGFKTQYAQVYSDDDPNLENDVQFAVTRALVGRYVRHDGPAPAGDVEGPWYTLAHTFLLETGVSTTPRAPIAGKAAARPTLDVLLRHPDMR
jgi:catechol 1,2-dioxygenase